VTSGERDRKLGDPANLKRELGTAHQRKGRYDPGWTPSEQRMRAKLMRQFIRRFDGPCGNTSDYLNSAVWCACGRGINRRGINGETVPCVKCAPDARVEPLT
jgi:hypothetical protein